MRKSRKLSADTSHNLSEYYGEGEMLGYAREGKMRSKLREAILAGFDFASLNEVLRDNDMLRHNVAIGPDFATRVNSLIDVAYHEGWLIKLCDVLAAARDGNKPVSDAIVAARKRLMDQQAVDPLSQQATTGAQHGVADSSDEFGGPALGVFKIFSRLPAAETYRLMRLVIIATFTAACLGIVAWIAVSNLLIQISEGGIVNLGTKR